MKRTIFTSVSNAGGTVYKIREFQRLGFRVVAGDASPEAVGRFYADAFYRLPWQREPNYFDVIFDIIRKEKVDIYAPAGEAEALAVARMRDKFLELGCTPTAANLKTLEMAVDKCTLFEFFAREVDIPLPAFHTVDSLESFEAGLDKLKGLRLCMKPAKTSGSRGFVMIDEGGMDPKKVFNTRVEYLTVTPDYVRRAFEAGVVPKMILMEFLGEGLNVNANMVCKNGELLFGSVHTRENMKEGLSTAGVILHNDEIVEYNRRIARALDTTGLITAQYIGNKIIEINPRWSTCVLHGSINEYLMGIQVWTGEPIQVDPQDLATFEGRTYQRYYETITYYRDELKNTPVAEA